MAPAKSKKKAGAKTSTTARTTRAKSKEVVAPAPIAPSRRSTRASSKEPLLSLDDPNKILRKSRKTPEVQQEVAVEPETPVIEEEELVEDEVVPSSPTPAINTIEEDIMEEDDVDDELPEVLLTSPPYPAEHVFANSLLSPIYEERTSELQRFISPQLSRVGLHTTEARGISYQYTSYHQLFGHLHDLLGKNPPAIEEARAIIEFERDEHAEPSDADIAHDTNAATSSPFQHIASSPPRAIVEQAQPTNSVFHTPSAQEPASRGGILSTLASPLRLIATPVGKLGRFFGRGAKTQPVQKTAPAPSFQAPITPSVPRTHSQASRDANAQLYPDIEQYHDRTPSYSHNMSRSVNRTPSHTVTADSDITGPSHTPLNPSILYLNDGTPIPAEFRTWMPYLRRRQEKDLKEINQKLAEQEKGLRVLTAEDQALVDKILLQQRFFEHWQARQTGARIKAAQQESTISTPLHNTTPMAGRKRTAEEIMPSTEEPDDQPPHTTTSLTDTPLHSESKRRRTQTPVGYGQPVPGQPGYHHVNEERGTTTNAAGSPEPSARTRGWSVAVPDDSDSDEESPPPSPGRTFGLPENFYDYSSDSDDDEMVDTSMKDASPLAPTPFTHKYTPAKPSGLRSVETMASSPHMHKEITPPQSPDLIIDPFFAQQATQYAAEHSLDSAEMIDAINVDQLVADMGSAYRDLLMNH